MTTTLPAVQATPGVDANELRVTRLRALRGPNYWRLAPVIACDLRSARSRTSRPRDVLRVQPSAARRAPHAARAPVHRGAAGGFVERLERGDAPPAHARARRARAADSRRRRRAVRSRRRVRRRRGLVGDRRLRGGGRRAAEHARRRPPRARVHRRRAGSTSPRRSHALHELCTRRCGSGRRTAAIVEEARRRGIPVRRLNSRSLVQLGLGRNLRRIQATLTDHTSAHRRGDRAGQGRHEARARQHRPARAARRRRRRTLEDALEVARRDRLPGASLKPLDASHGRGISRRTRRRGRGCARAWRGGARATAAAWLSSTSPRAATTACWW